MARALDGAGGLVELALGERAVVVGAELVSWSAVLTLREAGCTTALMTTTFDRPESYAAFALPGRLALGVPMARRTEVVRIIDGVIKPAYADLISTAPPPAR